MKHSRLRRSLVPTFRSLCSIAAPTFTNFGKQWALANLLILVPLYRSEVLDRTCRLWCRDFRSAVLVHNDHPSPDKGGDHFVSELPRRAAHGSQMNIR